MAGETFQHFEFDNNRSPYMSDTNMNELQNRIDNAIKAQKNRITNLKQYKSEILSTAGWYRIATVYSSVPAKASIISVSSRYNIGKPTSVLFSILTTYQNIKITQLNAIAHPLAESESNYAFTKIRALMNENENCFYIDVYYNYNTSNEVIVKNISLIDSDDNGGVELLAPTAETQSTNVKSPISIKYGKVEPYYENLNNYFTNSWSSNGQSVIEVDEIGLKHITVSCRNGTNVNLMQLPEEFRPTYTVLLNASNFTAVGYVTINTSGVVSVSSNIFTSGSSNLVFSGVYK